MHRNSYTSNANVQEVVCPLCSEAGECTVDVGVVDVHLDFSLESLHPAIDLQFVFQQDLV